MVQQIEFYLKKKINNLISLLILALFFTSCSSDSKKEYYPKTLGRTIQTYNSPSAYYGKSISRTYVNPYVVKKNRYYDNDRYYVPPKEYRYSNIYDNYDPRYRKKEKLTPSYFRTKILPFITTYGLIALLALALTL